MDWAEDFAGIRDEDLMKVWRYEEKYTTAVQLTSRDVAPSVSSLQSEEEWESWFKSDHFPRIDSETCPSGLVLILAKRVGEQEFTVPMQTASSDRLSLHNDEFPTSSTSHPRPLTFAALAENPPQAPLGNGQRSVRTLPFSKSTFQLISRSLHIHHSISSVVSRADIPAFFPAQVEMEVDSGEIYMTEVYHSRTTNSWDLDLALTVTHFPHKGLTYAILFGCPLSVEGEIIRRISRTRVPEASHPMLLAGILSELERSRHIAIVERMVVKLESRIFELDYASSNSGQSLEEERARQQQETRDDYLDMAYLRNGLVGWRHQLIKMVKQTEELENFRFGPDPRVPLHSTVTLREVSPGSDLAYRNDTEEVADQTPAACQSMSTPGLISNGRMRRVGRKIIGRFQAIIDEYDDKIRDCSMRLDGMAMATQWAQGETNVEIALATGKDSKHMRSIAIVTMIFLPGTFFASVFSMGFFSWFRDSGSSQVQVSSYIWIYITVTAVCTVLTIGLWYYFNIWRRAGQRKQEVQTALV